MNANTSLMKEINLHALRQAMKARRKLSKPQLAELTGLSVVTVNALVKILLARGEILEDAALPSSGGRPATAYRFNEMHSLVLTVYMHEEGGVDTLFVSVDTLYGEPVATERRVLREVTLENLDAIVEAYIGSYPAIKAMAFGLPGTELDGRMVMIDYEGLRGKALTKYFEEKYRRVVVFENDLNAAVAGYCCRRSVAKTDCVVGVYFPEKYPPGAGIFIHGQIYRGRDGFAGEINHLPLGIDWTHLPAAPDALPHALVKIVLSVACTFNPHHLVFYGRRLSREIIERLPELCAPRLDPALLPKLVLSEAFSADFAAGIRHIGLKQLEPVLPLRNGRTWL